MLERDKKCLQVPAQETCLPQILLTRLRLPDSLNDSCMCSQIHGTTINHTHCQCWDSCVMNLDAKSWKMKTFDQDMFSPYTAQQLT